MTYLHDFGQDNSPPDDPLDSLGEGWISQWWCPAFPIPRQNLPNPRTSPQACYTTCQTSESTSKMQGISIQVSGDVSTHPSLRANPNPRPNPEEVGMSPGPWIDPHMHVQETVFNSLVDGQVGRGEGRIGRWIRNNPAFWGCTHPLTPPLELEPQPKPLT